MTAYIYGLNEIITGELVEFKEYTIDIALNLLTQKTIVNGLMTSLKIDLFCDLCDPKNSCWRIVSVINIIFY